MKLFVGRLTIRCINFKMSNIFYSKFNMDGMYDAVFHSVSAFCNAGFELMGNEQSVKVLKR